MRFAPNQPLDFQQVDSLTLHLKAYRQTGRVNDMDVSLWDYSTGEWVGEPGLTWGDNTIASRNSSSGRTARFRCR